MVPDTYSLILETKLTDLRRPLCCQLMGQYELRVTWIAWSWSKDEVTRAIALLKQIEKACSPSTPTIATQEIHIKAARLLLPSGFAALAPIPAFGFRVYGFGFGVWGLGFGVWGLGFGVWGLGFGAGGWRCGVSRFGFRD